MTHVVDLRAAKEAHAAAVEAFLDLNRAEVELQVNRLRKIIRTPLARQTGALLLDGIRMCMFFACETRDEMAVELCAHEIWEHSRRRVGGENDIAVIPTIADSWASAWREEIAGNHDAALGYREFAFIKGDKPMKRARELLRKSGKFAPDDATEARLLVDCFADLVRSIRVCRPSIGTMARIRRQLGEPLAGSVFVELAKDPRVGFWSCRRTLMRVAFEMADRPDTPELKRARQKLLDRIEKQKTLPASGPKSNRRDPQTSPLAQLDERLILMERTFAWAQTKTFIDFTEMENCLHHARRLFRNYDFERRIAALEALWPVILEHGPST